MGLGLSETLDAWSDSIILHRKKWNRGRLNARSRSQPRMSGWAGPIGLSEPWYSPRGLSQWFCPSRISVMRPKAKTAGQRDR